MIYCSNCGTANRDGSRFCNECGFRLGVMVPCPSCNLPNLSTSRFCNFCGRRLMMGKPAPVEEESMAGDAIGSVGDTLPHAGCLVAGQQEVEPPGEFEASDVAVQERWTPEAETAETVPQGTGVSDSEISDVEIPESAVVEAEVPETWVAEAEVAEAGGVGPETGETATLQTDADRGLSYASPWAAKSGVVAPDWVEPGMGVEKDLVVLPTTAPEEVGAGLGPEMVLEVERQQQAEQTGDGDEQAEELPDWLATLSTGSVLMAEKPAPQQEFVGAIAMAQSVTRPLAIRSADDGADQYDAAAEMFTTVTHTAATVVGLERFRRVVKRGWFGW